MSKPIGLGIVERGRKPKRYHQALYERDLCEEQLIETAKKILAPQFARYSCFIIVFNWYPQFVNLSCESPTRI